MKRRRITPRYKRMFLFFPLTLPVSKSGRGAKETRWLEWATIQQEWADYGRFGGERYWHVSWAEGERA